MNKDIFVITEHLQGRVLEISYVMLAAARTLAEASGGQVVAVLLGHNVQALADDFNADRLLYLDHPALAEFTPDAYLKALAHVLPAHEPRLVLLGHTSVGMDIASGLSARMGWSLVCQSLTLHAENGAIRSVSQICGGKIMAECEVPGPTALLTMLPGGYRAEAGHGAAPPPLVKAELPSLEGLRIRLQQYIEPEVGDVDITREPILIGVGRGLQNQDDLELIEELAEALEGEVCASRPIVDLGWLPTARMVGKSGRQVKPKLYLALGISGAPEHIEGMADSELIVAINTDPTAPIFDIAQYGAEVDMLDLAEVLSEQVAEAKGG